MSQGKSAIRNSSVPDERQIAELPSHDDIAKLAYALWEARSCGDGLAEQDWFEAERRLRESFAASESAIDESESSFNVTAAGGR